MKGVGAAGAGRPDAGRPRRHVLARDDRRPELPVRRDQRPRQLQLPAALRAVHVHQGDPRRRPLRRAGDDDDRRDPHELRRRSRAPTTTSTCASAPNLRFPLDKRLYDDFERGDRDTYSVPIDGAVLDGLTVGDISRVQIEKSRDGAAGGWRLRGVKLVVNGRTLYARDGIERWLEDDHRTWRAPDFRQQRAGRPGAADHARPLGRGLQRLRRRRPRRSQPL